MVEYDKYSFRSKKRPRYMEKEENTYCLVC